MLPNRQDVVSPRPEEASNTLVPSPVPVDFSVPKLPPAFRQATAFGTGMPKTAVDKNRNPSRFEEEVRVPGYSRRMFDPAPNFIRSEELLYASLSRLISTAANFGHEPRPLDP